eukprot:356148-Amphidinium_carterae.1
MSQNKWSLQRPGDDTTCLTQLRSQCNPCSTVEAHLLWQGYMLHMLLSAAHTLGGSRQPLFAFLAPPLAAGICFSGHIHAVSSDSTISSQALVRGQAVLSAVGLAPALALAFSFAASAFLVTPACSRALLSQSRLAASAFPCQRGVPRARAHMQQSRLGQTVRPSK